jgi:Altered inheritance of mitochondria protein 21
MSDLNKRLQLGPQAPKKEEAPEEPVEEKEKTPLVDARKGRARGPARRAPAKSPAPASATMTEKPSNLVFSMPSTLWQIDPDEDLLNVTSHQDEVESPLNTKAAQSETPTLATNSAGQALHDSSEIASGTEKGLSPPSATEDLHAQQSEEVEKMAEAVDNLGNTHGQEPVKASDEPPVISQSTLAPPETEEEDLAASTTTLKPSTEDVE